MAIKSICLGTALLSVMTVVAAQSGFAGKTSPKTPAGGGTVVAGLPDIQGTTLGFVVKEPVAWGGSTVVDQASHIKQTQAGPNQDLCIVTTALYRTFNQGNVAAGSFVDIVYRNGSPVHTRHVAALAPKGAIEFEHKDLSFQEGMNVIQVKMDAGNQVPESDENNTFQIKVFVKQDCNGDGIVAGAATQIKSASPASAPKTLNVKGAAQSKTR